MVVGEKPLQKGARERAPWAPRIAIAFALGSSILTEGCMNLKHPECGFYFRGESALACDSVRCKIKDARKEFLVLEGKEKAAARSLRAKIAAGMDYKAELDTFNEIHAEMQRISRKLEGYRELETRIRDGKAEEGEIRSAFEEVSAIWERFLEFERALAQISRNM